MLHWSLMWSVITLIVMIMVMVIIMSVLQNMWFRYLINFVLLSAVHSAIIARRYFAQTGSDFGPQPVGWVVGEGGGVQYGGVGELDTGKVESDNSGSSSNNNNLSNIINDIKQVDNQVNSNINSVNQISISILPVPG